MVLLHCLGGEAIDMAQKTQSQDTQAGQAEPQGVEDAAGSGYDSIQPIQIVFLSRSSV
jgi:hypothetical protein